MMRYAVEPRRTAGYPWSIVDTRTGLVVYNGKRQNCESWAAVWNSPGATLNPSNSAQTHGRTGAGSAL